MSKQPRQVCVFQEGSDNAAAAAAAPFDIVGELWRLGLEPVLTSSLLSRLSALDLRRCGRVCKTWRRAVDALWARAEATAAAADDRMEVTVLQCTRERAVCTGKKNSNITLLFLGFCSSELKLLFGTIFAIST